MDESITVRKACIIRSLNEGLRYPILILGIIVAVVCVIIAVCYALEYFPFTAYNTFIVCIVFIDIVLLYLCIRDHCSDDKDANYLIPVGLGCAGIAMAGIIYSPTHVSGLNYPPIFESVVSMLVLIVGVPFANMYRECFVIQKE